LAEERLIRVQGARTSAATGKELKVLLQRTHQFEPAKVAATGKELKEEKQENEGGQQGQLFVRQQLGKN
jgi:hypothetical protein